MARFNKVILVGRFTRDPEIKTIKGDGKLASFGFAVTNSKKNKQTGEWEDTPMFIDCEAFDRGEFGKTATTIDNYCRKGSQVLIEGSLKLDSWDDKNTGIKRQKHKIMVDSIQLLDAKSKDSGFPEDQDTSKPENKETPVVVGEDIPF